MAIGDAMVAPTGVQNQMYGQPSRVPGYSQGLGQAPGQMALPPEPMPIGRPTAVVGGPAYFTPQGYNAPPQPTEAFMPTDRMPDPIGQQFMRQMQSPMGQQFQQQYEATQAPIREAEMAQRAEQQAAQDARFQEMMDRIAELEGQLATPTEPTAPMPTDPYIPGQTPFPGIPDFIRDMDFSNLNLPDFSNFDYDDIMRQAPESFSESTDFMPGSDMEMRQAPMASALSMNLPDMEMRQAPQIESPFGLPLPTEFGMTQIEQAPIMPAPSMNLSDMEMTRAPIMPAPSMNLSDMAMTQIGQAPMMPLLPNFYDTMQPKKLDSLSQGVRNFLPSISSSTQPSQMMRAPLPLQSQLINPILEDSLKEKTKRLLMPPSLNLR